jgi:Ca-activated chloride channel family protein
MLGLAQHGGGNYYFVESPKQLASIFERELHDLRYIVAQNARIELSLGSGVQLVDVIGSECGRDDGRIVISLGDLSAGDRREMTVELTVPEGTGTLRVARGELRSDRGAVSDGGFATEIRYSDDAAELLRGKDWDVQPKVDIAISTRKVERAMQALDEGRTEDAGKEISEAAAELGASSALVNSPAAAPLIQSQIKRLNEYSRQMASPSVDARKVKKSVQYDNYEVQTKKKP